MLRSRKASSVVLGSFFLAVTLACASGEEPDSGWSMACEDAEGIRLDESECDEDDPDGLHRRGRTRYYPSGTTIPAVGSRMPMGGTSVRPGGSVGGFPKSGGFGGHGGSTGS